MKNKNLFENVDFIKSDDEMLKKYNGILYHYTTVEGLLGILQSNVIWATSYPFLNDSSEIVYGRRLCKNIINERITKSQKEEEKILYTECLELQDNNKGRIYITCFCERGNLLSQWRGYAKNGLGFSLGLESKYLLSEYRQYPYNLIKIKKVEYDLVNQKKIINNLLDEAVKYIDENNITSKKFISELAKTINKKIEECIVFFKDAAFEEEKEWRAIYYEKDRELIETHYRARFNRIVDYKEFNLAPTNKEIYKDKLPICEIISGPGIENDATNEVIRMILKDYKFAEKVNLMNSSIPFKIV